MTNPKLLSISLAVLLGTAALAGPAMAQTASLRGDVVATQDTLRLGDLVQGAPSELSDTPVFRAPALGQTGTIQTSRIAEAAARLGLSGLDTGGRLQISITRAARQIGAGEIESVLRRSASEKLGLDAASTGISFEGPAPTLTLPADLKGEVMVGELVLDRRTRRFSATLWIGPSPAERRASLKVAGTLLDLVEVAVLTRALDKGEAVKTSDIIVERRPREAVSSDAGLDGAAPMEGRVARRPLTAGSVLRAGDVARPEIVQRGEIVTAVFETPGMMLSMRAKASEAGAIGDVISVVNLGSKKTVPATVIAVGKVSVRPGQTARVVAGALPSQN